MRCSEKTRKCFTVEEVGTNRNHKLGSSLLPIERNRVTWKWERIYAPRVNPIGALTMSRVARSEFPMMRNDGDSQGRRRPQWMTGIDVLGSRAETNQLSPCVGSVCWARMADKGLSSEAGAFYLIRIDRRRPRCRLGVFGNQSGVASLCLVNHRRTPMSGPADGQRRARNPEIFR